MSDNPILTKAQLIIAQYLPLVNHTKVVESNAWVVDENAGFINARKAAMVHVQGIMDDLFEIKDYDYDKWIKHAEKWKSVFSVLDNMK